METNKLSYLDVIEDTVDYYSIHPRAYSKKEGDCVYIDENGLKCALGRYAKNPEKLQQIKGGIDVICEYYDEELDGVDSWNQIMEHTILKEEVSHLVNYEFWKKLQSLHDSSSNWKKNNKEGQSLTLSGQKEYIRLLETDWE